MGRNGDKRPSGNSFPCNGRLIRFYRERKGLTQAELAQRSGYSVRLIGKAEAGKPIKIDTIEILAETLSDEATRLKPVDLISAPVTLSEKYVQELLVHTSKVVPQIEHFLGPGFELVCFCNDDSISLQGSWHGPDGLATYLQKLFHLIQMPEGLDVSSACNLFPVGDDVVVWYLIHPTLKSEQDGAAPGLARSLSLTSKLRFTDGLLTKQEDRIVIH